jgi:hypothetical protein
MTKPFTGRQLVGHTSSDQAYVVDDYPYGFRLRCRIRYWVETKAGFGQRFVSQTTNPKKPGEVWNKPKAGTYCPLIVMYLDDETGHVKHAVLHTWGQTLEQIEGWGELELDDSQRATQKMVLALARRERGAADHADALY